MSCWAYAHAAWRAQVHAVALTSLERINREALAIQCGSLSMVAWLVSLEVAVAASNDASWMHEVALHQGSPWICRTAFGHWVVGNSLTW